MMRGTKKPKPTLIKTKQGLKVPLPQPESDIEQYTQAVNLAIEKKGRELSSSPYYKTLSPARQAKQYKIDMRAWVLSSEEFQQQLKRNLSIRPKHRRK